MKVLKATCLVLLTFSIFSSCKKDVDSTSSLQGGVTSLDAKSQSANNDKKPLLTASQSPAPVKKGDPVTVSYSATDLTSAAAVECGRIKIYQLKAGVWTEVASGNAPTVTFTFTPETADDCAYTFRAGFDPGGTVQCRGAYSGVDYLTQQDFCADVIDPCVNVFTVEGNASAVNLNNGLYEFTISYTLTSPTDVSGVKFQGGATAGGNTGHAVTDLGNLRYAHINNNNTVLKWEGDLKACVPQVLTFKYTRNFSCPASGALVTGDWTASAGGLLLGSIESLPYSCE